MRNLLPLATLASAFCALAWSYAAQPLPPDNLQAYAQCIEHYPQQYCRFEHLPSTVTNKQR